MSSLRCLFLGHARAETGDAAGSVWCTVCGKLLPAQIRFYGQCTLAEFRARRKDLLRKYTNSTGAK